MPHTRVAKVRRLKLFALSAIAIIVVTALVMVATVTWIMRRPLPQLSGTKQVTELTKATTITRDAYGVPFVDAENPQDLFFAQGYAHAQDRLFHMDLARRQAMGQMAALVGPQHSALTTDTLARTLGFERIARAELAELTPQTRSALQSYADGINAYLAARPVTHTDVSLVVLGSIVELPPITPWEPVHSLAILKRHGWLTSANVSAEIGRSAAFHAVRDEQLVADLYPAYPDEWHKPTIQQPGPAPETTQPASPDTPETQQQSQSAWPVQTPHSPNSPRIPWAPPVISTDHPSVVPPATLRAVARALSTDQKWGNGPGLSHAIAIAPQHSATGAPLLSGEPHQHLTAPDAWYQNGLHCVNVTAECPYTVSGFSLPGVPGVFFGRNANIAWAMTSSQADVADLFLERLQNDQVWRDGTWQPLSIQEDTIAIAGAPPHKIRIRSTTHGPLLSDVQGIADQALGAPQPAASAEPPGQTDLAVSLAWAGAGPSRTLDGILALNRASSWTEFNESARLFDFPAPALTYADRDGRIAFQVPGRIPVRGSSNEPGKGDGTWPRAGWDPEWDWLGWRDYESLPTVLNPETGVIVAANQQPAIDGKPISVDFDYGYRSDRIMDLIDRPLRAGQKLTLDDLVAIHGDVRETFAEVLVPQLLTVSLTNNSAVPAEAADFTEPAIAELRRWADNGYQMSADSAGAAYYAAVYSSILQLTFGDEPAGSVQPDGSSRWAEVLLRMFNEPSNPWWDNKQTAMVIEQRDQIISQALYQARVQLTAGLGKNPSKWRWQDLHQVELRQEPLGAAKAAWWAQRLVNPPAQGTGGGVGTVNMQAWDPSRKGDYSVTQAAAARYFVDLAQPGTQRWSGVLGVSGHRASPHFDDQFDTWRSAAVLPWAFELGKREELKRNVLTLEPAPPEDVLTPSGTP